MYLSAVVLITGFQKTFRGLGLNKMKQLNVKSTSDCLFFNSKYEKLVKGER